MARGIGGSATQLSDGLVSARMNVDERIQGLELALLRTRRFAVGAGIIGAVSMTVALASVLKPAADTIEIHDDHGRLRIALGMANGEPQLEIFDRNNQSLTSLGLYGGEPRLEMRRPELGSSRDAALVLRASGPEIAIHGSEGGSLELRAEHLPGMSMRFNGGAIAWTLAADSTTGLYEFRSPGHFAP